MEEGETYEQIFDVACSDGGSVEPESQRCPDNGARVDLSDCSITENVGASSLEVAWQDPDHDPEHRAFYYARALENPTCRWSTWDAVKAGVPAPRFKKTIQKERGHPNLGDATNIVFMPLLETARQFVMACFSLTLRTRDRGLS